MKKPQNKGISILGIIFVCFILILVLSYFHISVKSIINNPTTKENINYVIKGSKYVWNNYLKKPTTYARKSFIKSIKYIQSVNLANVDTNASTPKAKSSK